MCMEEDAGESHPQNRPCGCQRRTILGPTTKALCLGVVDVVAMARVEPHAEDLGTPRNSDLVLRCVDHLVHHTVADTLAQVVPLRYGRHGRTSVKVHRRPSGNTNIMGQLSRRRDVRTYSAIDPHHPTQLFESYGALGLGLGGVTSPKTVKAGCVVKFTCGDWSKMCAMTQSPAVQNFSCTAMLAKPPGASTLTLADTLLALGRRTW